MRVEFLGTSGFHPTERRHTSCVLLPEVGIAFDAGTGMFRLPSRLQTKTLSIFLSHSHLDHIVGLTYLLPSLINRSIESAVLHGSARTLAAVRDHLFAEPVFPVRLPFEYVELAGSVDLPGGGRLTMRSQNHPGGSLGYRIDWPDRSMAYVTDTTADGSGVDFVRGVDLLIHECNFTDDLQDLAVMTGHSHTTPVCELARDAGVGRLIMTHFDPHAALDDPVDLPKARSIFPAAEVAEDGMVCEF
ncbi:MAG: MBL fold metallo-hydrolase [Planctomycetaceae bacterium]